MRGIVSKGLVLFSAFFLVFSLNACFEGNVPEKSDDLYVGGEQQEEEGDNQGDDQGDVEEDTMGGGILDVFLPGTGIDDPPDDGDEPGDGDSGDTGDGDDSGSGEEPADPPEEPAVPSDPPVTGDVYPIRMKVEYGSTLGISWFPEFKYDCPDSGGWGTVTDLGNGKGWISLPGDALKVEPLEFIPAILPWTDVIPITETIRVEINSNDFSGEIDFCTGEASFDFDALFQARMELIEPFYGMVDEIVVVCDMTTGISTGDAHSLEGTEMGDNGRLTLAGVAVVPETDDWLVNTILSLPTDARVLMNARFDFPDGWLECPDAAPLADPDVTLALGRQGTISFKAKNTDIENVPFIQYDAFDTLLVSKVGPVNNGVANVVFDTSNVEIPDIDMSPYPLGFLGYNMDRYSVKLNQLEGTVNFCTGEVDLIGEIVYTWKFGQIELPYTAKRVESVVTTGTDTGRYMSVTGEPMNEYGDGTLVAIEDIQYGVYPLSIVKDTILRLPFNIKVDRDMDLCDCK